MKKIIVLVTVMSLMAGSAFAVIKGSKHDLSNGTNSSTSTSDEICVFCHTPHNANTSVTLAPLWNRTTTDATGNVYTSGTLNVVVNLTDVNATDAPLCLSCHAGSGLTIELQNPPNAAPTAGNTIGLTVSANALVGPSLANDHPIGFNYLPANIGAGFNTEPITGITFNGGTGGEMWCSTCHDVHENANAPFLVMSNAGSNLCLACHAK